MLDTIFQDAEEKLQERINHLKSEYGKLRIGQATPSLIEDVRVNAYDTTLTLKELGAISAPQPTLLVISCWDEGIIDAVVKGLQQANLGVNPVVDGKTIKVPIPSLTDERRESMSKEVGEITEKVRVDIRQIRHEKLKSVDELKDEKKLSDDEHESAKDKLQAMVEETNEEVEKLKRAKLEDLTSK